MQLCIVFLELVFLSPSRLRGREEEGLIVSLLCHACGGEASLWMDGANLEPIAAVVEALVLEVRIEDEVAGADAA